MATAFVPNRPPADLEHDVPDGRWEGIVPPLLAPRTSSGCAARSASSHTLARARGASGSGTACCTRALRPRARGADRQPGRADGAGRPEGDLPVAAGRWRPTPTTAGQMYPDQSLYPADSVPTVVRRINNAFSGPTRSSTPRARPSRDWFAPIVADAEAGFGGPLNAFELMKAMIEAGAAGVHFEDQLASREEVRAHGRQGAGADRQFVRTLVAARLAADVMGVPTVLVARTDADGAKLLTRDVDERDREFILTGERTAEGFFRLRRRARLRDRPRPGLRPLRRPGLVRDLDPRPRGGASASPRASTRASPASCWPTTARRRFNWKKNLDDATIARFQRELGAMGYKFQFVTLAGFHALNHAHVRAGPRLPRPRDGRLHASCSRAEFAAEARGLHRDEAPARGRHRLLRPGGPGGLRRDRVHPRAHRVHRGGPVLSAPGRRPT